MATQHKWTRIVRKGYDDYVQETVVLETNENGEVLVDLAIMVDILVQLGYQRSGDITPVNAQEAEKISG